jgi:hypothetical protein
VYTISRRVQGRLNDIGLLAASSAARDEAGAITPEATSLIQVISRYIRLFNVLLYASVSTRFAPLLTPYGLEMLVEYGELTNEERELMLDGGIGHNAVMGWLWAACVNGLQDGRLPGAGAAPMCPAAQRDAATPRASAAPSVTRLTFETKFLELRATYATIADALSGRMPLAYAQLVQILVDMLVVSTPFALLPKLGAPMALLGTAVLTFFYSSVLNLAKVFLDPFDNESYGGRLFGISINVGTLLQETNLGSTRWLRMSKSLPSAARPVTAAPPPQPFASEVEQPPPAAQARGVVRVVQR